MINSQLKRFKSISSTTALQPSVLLDMAPVSSSDENSFKGNIEAVNLLLVITRSDSLTEVLIIILGKKRREKMPKNVHFKSNIV